MPETKYGVEFRRSLNGVVISVSERGTEGGNRLLRGMFAAMAAGYGLVLGAGARRVDAAGDPARLSASYAALCILVLLGALLWRNRRSASYREAVRVCPGGLQTAGRIHPLAAIDEFCVFGPGGVDDAHGETDCRAPGAPLWPSRVFNVIAICSNERIDLVCGVERDQARVIAEELAGLLNTKPLQSGGHRGGERLG